MTKRSPEELEVYAAWMCVWLLRDEDEHDSFVNAMADYRRAVEHAAAFRISVKAAELCREGSGVRGPLRAVQAAADLIDPEVEK